MSFLLVLAALAQDPAPATNTPAEPVIDTQAEAASPETAEEDDIVVTGEKDPDTKKICRLEKPVGTSIKKRVCRTMGQIRAEAASARARFGDMQSAQGARDAASPDARGN